MRKAPLVLVPILCALMLSGCADSRRFFDWSDPPPPSRAASIAPAATWREAPPPLLECTATCQRECRSARAPKWCMYYKPPI